MAPELISVTPATTAPGVWSRHGEGHESTSYGLCRCGDSKNTPFCDNTHEKAEFRDRGALGETGEGFEKPGGSLEIKRAPNGPLLASGNFTIITGAGREAWRGTKAALCRCGASKNKPFCDGGHVEAGFKAD